MQRGGMCEVNLIYKHALRGGSGSDAEVTKEVHMLLSCSAHTMHL